MLEKESRYDQKNIPDKGTKYDEVEKSISFQSQNNEMNVIGHVNGNYGVYEITGTIKVLETSVSGKCITEDHRISIIWP